MNPFAVIFAAAFHAAWFTFAGCVVANFAHREVSDVLEIERASTAEAIESYRIAIMSANHVTCPVAAPIPVTSCLTPKPEIRTVTKFIAPKPVSCPVTSKCTVVSALAGLFE